MDGNWNFYFCRVGDKIASIYLNLDYQSLAPVALNPIMACVRVRLNNPRSDGLSTDEDFDALSALEDSLVADLSDKLNANYVGRNTCGGCRDFYFYINDEKPWNAAVNAALVESEFEFESSARNDPEWNTYLEFLYPSGRDLQRMKNRDTCDVFESHGDKLDSEREIDHWVYFDSKQSQQSFLAAVMAKGFEIRQGGGPDGEQTSYWAQIFRIDVLSRDNIDSVCLELYDLAKEIGGKYDGWEAPVHKP